MDYGKKSIERLNEIINDSESSNFVIKCEPKITHEIKVLINDIRQYWEYKSNKLEDDSAVVTIFIPQIKTLDDQGNTVWMGNSFLILKVENDAKEWEYRVVKHVSASTKHGFKKAESKLQEAIDTVN